MTISDSLIFCGFMLIIFCGGIVGMVFLTERDCEMNIELTDVELVVILDGLRLLSMNTKYPADKKVASELAERLKNERRRISDKGGSNRTNKT